MTVLRCRPLADLFNIQGDPSRTWAKCLDDIPQHGRQEGACTLDADVKETSGNYVVSVEVPGMEQKEIKVTVLENVLTLKGEKKREAGEKGTSYYLRERCFGGFERSFTLPTNVQNDKVAASYRNGILSILLPKVEEATPREIEVRAA